MYRDLGFRSVRVWDRVGCGTGWGDRGLVRGYGQSAGEDGEGGREFFGDRVSGVCTGKRGHRGGGIRGVEIQCVVIKGS